MTQIQLLLRVFVSSASRRWMVLDNHFRSSQLAGAIVYHFHRVTPHPSARPKIEGSGIWNGHAVAASEMSSCYLKKPLSMQFFSEQRQGKQHERNNMSKLTTCQATTWKWQRRQRLSIISEAMSLKLIFHGDVISNAIVHGKAF